VCVCVMKIVSWNVRGLGRLDKRKEVCKLVREKNPHIVCLQETKLKSVMILCARPHGAVRLWATLIVPRLGRPAAS
jgi:endonuclease/exonuclease/phosphatase family metal-dependent hydrolase